MKLKELISILQKENQEMPVYFHGEPIEKEINPFLPTIDDIVVASFIEFDEDKNTEYFAIHP